MQRSMFFLFFHEISEGKKNLSRKLLLSVGMNIICHSTVSQRFQSFIIPFDVIIFSISLKNNEMVENESID